MGGTNRIGTTVMIPVGFLGKFDDFADDRGTNRSLETRAAYQDHMTDPPSVDRVEELNEKIDEDGVPRPHAKVMLDASILREDSDFRDDRETDRSEEICAAMKLHLDDPPEVRSVTDDPAARVRARQSSDAGGY